MSRYLDIGVVRIQQWLSRTPHLRGRRGASTMIRTATDRTVIAQLLSGLAVELNPEAGAIDGVVSLRTDSSDDLVSAQARDTVLAHLRTQLPAASFRASWWDGPSYAGARRATATSTVSWPAPLPEWPAAATCDWCRTWPAIHRRTDLPRDDDRPEVAVCADCDRRATEAGRATSVSNLPGPERDLLVHLPADHQLGAVPDDYSRLAALSLGPIDAPATHLATIFIDGNRIGALIKNLPDDLLAGAAAAITSATWAALIDAVNAIAPGPDGTRALRVIPHLVGGDDVLVSIPAHGAWRFTTTYQQRFSEALGAFFGRAGTPTASAGVVIHHQSEPFAQVVELAESLLTQAKADHVSEQAALAWQSVTHDGVQPVPRPSVTLDTLTLRWPDLTGLVTVAPAQRQELAALCRHHEVGSDTLSRQLHRMGLLAVTEPFRPADSAEPPLSLTEALAIVRWWQR